MKSIITISGKHGSGKSSAAKKVADILNYSHFSSGDFLRNIAKGRKITIEQLVTNAEFDESIDKEIDAILKSKNNDENLVIDSRLAFHWIPDSFKVFLDIDPDIASKRMFQDLKDNKLREKSEYAYSINDMKINMLNRHNSDVKRYKTLYGINHTDHKNFDLVVNTGLPENDLNTVVKKIVMEYKKRYN